MYALNFLPGMLILPISWLETVIQSKKLKSKTGFQRGKYGLRALGIFLGGLVVALGVLGRYRILIMLGETPFFGSCSDNNYLLLRIVLVVTVTGCFTGAFGVFWLCRRKIMLYAGDLMSPGIIEMMNKTVYYIGIISTIYTAINVGYAYFTSRPSDSAIRPAPLFYSGQFFCYLCMHVRLIKYFRYQCRKSLTPNPIIREAKFWDRLDKQVN